VVDDESGESMELIEEVPLGLGEVNTKSNQIGISCLRGTARRSITLEGC